MTHRHRLAALLFACTASFAAQTAPLSASPSVVLKAAQIKRLTTFIHDEPAAAKLFGAVQKDADAALQATPDPIELIQSEGKLAGDPVKVRTWKALDDMGRMRALAWAYVVTDETKYADKGRAFLLAWAKTNRSEGNPINETNLEQLIVAFDLLASTLSTDDRAIVETYLRAVAAQEIETGKSPRHTSVNNWNSHRVKVLGLIAFALHDQDLIDQAVAAYKKQIANNIRPDGSTIDFEERDALHYQEYSIRPLLTFVAAARNNDMDLYNYAAPNGASLSSAVAFLVKYANGSETHPEFVNSKVEFDRKRAAAGQGDYKAGRIWNPREGLASVERAERFDPTLLPLVAKLSQSDSQRLPTWETLLNAATRP